MSTLSAASSYSNYDKTENNKKNERLSEASDNKLLQRCTWPRGYLQGAKEGGDSLALKNIGGRIFMYIPI